MGSPDLGIYLVVSLFIIVFPTTEQMEENLAMVSVQLIKYGVFPEKGGGGL